MTSRTDDFFGDLAGDITEAASDLARQGRIAGAGQASGRTGPAAPAVSGPSSTDLLFGGGPNPRASATRLPQYPTVEEANTFLQEQFSRYVADPAFDSGDLLEDAKALGYAPEVIWELRNAWDEIGTPEAVMSALSEAATFGKDISEVRSQVAATDGVAQLIQEFGSDLTQGELDYVLTILAAMPETEYDNQSILAKAGEVTQAAFKASVSALTLGGFGVLAAGKAAPHNLRSEVAAKAIEYLREKPLDSAQDRKDFLVEIYQQAQRTTRFAGFDVDEEGNLRRGLLGDLGTLVSSPFRGTSDQLADWMALARSPSDFAHRQHLGAGENFALGIGLNPGDNGGHWLDTVISAGVKTLEYGTPGNHFGDALDASTPYEVVSGTFDFLLNLSPVDPINAVASLGSAAKLARNIPRGLKTADGLRDITKGQAVLRALVPFSGRSMDLPLMNRGYVTRLGYAAMSRTAETMLNSQEFGRAAKWIAQTQNAAEIAERYPQFRGKIDILNALAQTESAGEVRDVVRLGIQGQWARDAGNVVSLIEGKKVKNSARYADQLDVGAREGRIHLADVFDDFDGYGARGVWEAIPTGNEALVRGRITKIGNRLSGASNEVQRTTSSGRNIVIRSSGQNYAAYDATTGNFLGALEVTSQNIGVVSEARRQGIATALLDEAERVSPGAKATMQSASDVSGQGAALLNVPATTESVGLFRVAEAVQDGTEKVIISGRKAPDWKVLDLATSRNGKGKFAVWAAGSDNDNAVSAAAKVATNTNLEDLSVEELTQIQRWADTIGADAVQLGDHMLSSTRGQAKTTTIIDGAGAGDPRPLQREMLDVMQSDQVLASVANENRTQWIFIDMPRAPLGTNTMKRFGKFLARKVPVGKKTRHWWRRVAPSFKDSAVPDSIHLDDARTGSQELRTWLRALGMSDESWKRWVSDYMAAQGPTARRDIIFQALREAGEQIENPLMQNEFLRWNEKSAGIVGYERGADGIELGLIDGVPHPISRSMQTQTFSMPQWKLIKGSMRRARHSRMMPKSVLRGFGKTREKRERLVRKYKNSYPRHVRKDMKEFSDWEWASMAYSDLLGDSSGKIANAFSSMVAGPYKAFHSAFSVMQLVGRPIAWASRVLLEETVRANMTGLPSLWKNPFEYMDAFWSANAWRKLPDNVQVMGRQVDDALGTLLDGAIPDAVMLDSLDEVIPGIRNILADMGVDASDRLRVRTVITEIVKDDLWTDGSAVRTGRIGSRSNPLRRALSAKPARKSRKQAQRLANKNIPKGWRVEDAPEIANRSMFSILIREYERTQEMSFAPGRMSKADLDMYGEGYGRQLGQATNDYDVASTLDLMLDDLTGTARFDANKFARSTAWRELRPNARRMAQERGWRYTSDAELAEVYLRETQSRWIEGLFGAWWKDADGLDDPIRKAKILEGARSKQLDIDTGAGRVTANLREDTDLLRAGRELAEIADIQGVQLPRINAHFNPRFGQSAQNAGFMDKMRQGMDYAFYYSGEKFSQVLNRQPGYIHAYDRWFKKAKTMGWSDDAAGALAHERAYEVVNYVFYDNKNTARFLQSMNRVVPFFSAWWEVFSTWFYKIPAQETLLLGYPHMIRRTDRFFDAMVNLGIATPNESGFTLNLSPNPETGTFLGDGLSALGHSVVRSPVSFVEMLTNVGKAAFDEDPVDWSKWLKDDFTLAIGSPVDPMDHGLMAVNSYGFGFTPALSMAVGGKLPFFDTPLIGKIPFAVDEKKGDLVEGQSLVDFYNQNPNLDQELFLVHNREALIEALGRENYNKLLAGDAAPDELVFSKSIDVNITGSSVVGDWIDRTMFPFGKYQGFGGMIGALSPTWLSYVARGVGIMDGDPDTVNGIAGAFFGPTGQYQIGAELISQYQHLEASEGLISKVQSKTRNFYRKLNEAGFQVTAEDIARDGLPEGAGDDLADMLADIEMLNEEIVRRAQQNAGGALMMRGILGFLGPSTPRMVFEQQEAASTFWATRDVAEAARSQGSDQFYAKFQDRLLKNGGAPDFDMINSLVVSWLNDETGDDAKKWLKANHPGLMPFIQGRTFWGPAGPPAEAGSLDKFFEQVENGEREVYPPAVWLMRYMRANVAMDKELSIALEFGSSPEDQFQAYLNNGAEFRALTEQYDLQFEALEYLDQELNEGAYGDWQSRNAADEFVLLKEIERDVWESRQFIDDAEAALRLLDLRPDEVRDITGKISAGYREMLDRINRYQAAIDEVDPAYQNPRERLISQYFEEIAEPYYQARNGLFDRLGEAETSRERSLVFDQLRMLDNQHFTQFHNVEGIAVPSEIERKWRGLTEEEREADRIENTGKPPEWLSLADMAHIAEVYPEAPSYLPSKTADSKIYDEAAEYREQIRAQWRAGEISEYERNKAYTALDDWVIETLWDTGRQDEVRYREAWPIQRLGLLGMLPQSLQPLLEQVNAIQEALKAADKTIGSDYGDQLHFWMIDYTLEYIRTNPQAAQDLAYVGGLVVDEEIPSRVVGKLFFDAFAPIE